MRHVPIDSSAIASLGYEPAERLLEVRFTSGRRYRYFEVPPGVVRRLLGAESHGRAFNALVRDRYAYTEL